MHKCIIKGESLLKQGISQNLLSSMLYFINCNEEAGYTCDATMLDHFIAILKAYRKHLEKNKGKFGKMAAKIALHHEKGVFTEL